MNAAGCGCLQGLASSQRGKVRAKDDVIEDEAASCRDEDTQAKIKAFHEAKQRQEDEAKILQERENEAKKRDEEKAKALQEQEDEAKERDNEARIKAFHEAKKKHEEEAKALQELENQQRAKAKAAVEADGRYMPNEGSNLSLDSTFGLPLEESNLSLDNTWVESSIAATSEDAQDNTQYTETLDSLAQVIPTTAKLPAPSPGLQGITERDATSKKVPDGMEAAVEGLNTPVAFQGKANDGVQMATRPHDQDRGCEPAMEAVSSKDGCTQPLSLEGQLNSCELHERRSKAAAAAAGSAGFARTVVFVSCAVVVVAFMAFQSIGYEA